jgi:ATP-dependent DNA helicase RecG
VLDELPPGRHKIDTFAIGEEKRERLNAFIEKQVSESHGVYIVCPAIDENDETELKSVTEHAQELKNKVFSKYRVGIMHGRMKPAQKEAVMADFAAGNLDILVSTTVIEVGVDNPNATLMVIENAERFGLSQLHQLRGRVGRGTAKSFCVLVKGGGGELADKRLGVLCQTADGFKIAEKDLELRGPGEVFGSRQHGLPSLTLAGLSGDTRVLKRAQLSAEELLKSDPELALPAHGALKRQIAALFERCGAEIFS